MGNISIPCSQCGGSGGLSGQKCRFCLGCGRIVIKSEKTIFNKPYAHDRPNGTKVCYHCNGRGRAEYRTCSVCGGKGWRDNDTPYPLTTITKEEWKEIKKTYYPKGPTENILENKTSIFGALKNLNGATSGAPYSKKLMPSTLCLACKGKNQTVVCARCDGSGIDPDSMDSEIFKVASNWFEQGWRPLESSGCKIFNLQKTYKVKRIPAKIWHGLNCLVEEKRLKK
jgi:ribosomal protein L40E